MDTITLTPEERAKHRDMILSPYKWPHMYLPLKRRDPKTGLGWQCAMLRSAISKKNYERAVEQGVPLNFAVDVNMTLFGLAVDGEVERITFSSPDEILDAGWIVD
jgi:hypothetical protein